MNALHDSNDGLAELELLASNQKKLNALTSRMTSILSGFDRRLSSLEGTLLPIHHRTQALQRVEKNVDATLEALKHTLGHFDVVEEEEPKILQGPSGSNLYPYFDTIDRVVRGLEYLQKSELKSQEAVMMKMNELVEIGARNLTTLMSDWVTAESHPIDPNEYVPRRLPLPILSGSVLEAIIPILSYQKSLPSNPANGYAPFLASLAAYSDIRGVYLGESIASLGHSLIEFTTHRVNSCTGVGNGTSTFAGEEEDLTYHRGSAGAKEWVKAILDLAENEHAIVSNMLRSLNPPSSNATIASTFSRLTHPILRHFTATISTVHNLIKRDLTSHTLMLLDLIATLSELAMRWNGVIVNPAGKAKEDISGQEGGAHTLQEQLQALKTTAVNIFPVFLNDLKSLPKQRENEVPSTNINEITHMGFSFMKEACEYADVIEPLLDALGPGNWMMSGASAPSRSISAGMSGDTGLFAQFMCDVLSTTIAALDARSKAIRQLSTASIFLMNNIGHLQRELTNAPLLLAYLSQSGFDILASSMRQARAKYLDAWQPAISALMDETGGLNSKSSSKLGGGVLGGGDRAQKEDVKQRFTKFFEGLDDLERLHMAFPLSRSDDDLKENLKREVLRLVMPLYSRFVVKHTAHTFSSNPAKYLRPEAEVEERLVRMFS